MAYDEKLADRIRQVFGARGDIAERKMFGGLAFLLRGRMCCGIVGSGPMDFTRKPLRGFVYVSPPAFRGAAGLRTWLARGERVAEEKAAELSKRRSSRRTSSAAGRRRATSQARRSQRG